MSISVTMARMVGGRGVGAVALQVPPLQCRWLKIYPEPPKVENVNLPEKRRLPVMPRMPHIYTTLMTKVPKGTRELHRMMGEEVVHNKLLLNQFGVIATSGGALTHKHYEIMRNSVQKYLEVDKGFAIYRVDPPFKPVTEHGLGKKLGGGKGSIKHFVTPVKAGRVILEVGGALQWEEVRRWLTRLARKLPFKAIVANSEIIDNLDKEEERLMHANENPNSFEWLVRNNMFDCHRFLSPRDKVWFGRYVYRDRTLNQKWANASPGRNFAKPLIQQMAESGDL